MLLPKVGSVKSSTPPLGIRLSKRAIISVALVGMLLISTTINCGAILLRLGGLQSSEPIFYTYQYQSLIDNLFSYSAILVLILLLGAISWFSVIFWFSPHWQEQGALGVLKIFAWGIGVVGILACGVLFVFTNFSLSIIGGVDDLTSIKFNN